MRSLPAGRQVRNDNGNGQRPSPRRPPSTRSNVGRDEIPACCFAGGTGKPGFHPGRHTHPLSTGSASGRLAAAPLHPWLQPVAPFGAETTYAAGAWEPARGGQARQRGQAGRPGLPPVRCGLWPHPTATTGQWHPIKCIAFPEILANVRPDARLCLYSDRLQCLADSIIEPLDYHLEAKHRFFI